MCATALGCIGMSAQMDKIGKVQDMRKEISDYIAEMEGLIAEAHKTGDKYAFQDPVYDITDELNELERPFEAVEPILRLIERSPDIDYGGPGPFGTFLEKFCRKGLDMGYEELLIESLRRKPTRYTIFLLARICNDKSDPDRPCYVKTIKQYANSDCLDDDWRKIIQDIGE